MNIFEILSMLDITTHNSLKYRSIAFDGCFFYITEMVHGRIYKYDKSFNLIEYIETCRAYTAICYDIKQRCFWCSCEKYPDKVFKLDQQLNELDCLTVACYDENWGYIQSICCDCCSEKLLIAFCSCIIEMDKSSLPRIAIIQESCSKLYLSVLYLYTCYVVAYIKHDQKFLAIYSFEHKLLDRFCLAEECNIQDMVFYQYIDGYKGKYGIYMLVSNRDRDSIVKCKIEGNDAYYRDTPCSHCKGYDCCYSNDCDANKHKCKDECDNRCKDKCENKCEDRGRCKEKCKVRCDDRDKDKCEVKCDDIIESIALVEAALAHILNAEGEKIQKVVKCSNDIDEILETNRLVNKTITSIVHLEQVLYSKLDLVIDKECERSEASCYDTHIDICLRQLQNG